MPNRRKLGQRPSQSTHGGVCLLCIHTWQEVKCAAGAPAQAVTDPSRLAILPTSLCSEASPAGSVARAEGSWVSVCSLPLAQIVACNTPHAVRGSAWGGRRRRWGLCSCGGCAGRRGGGPVAAGDLTAKGGVCCYNLTPAPSLMLQRTRSWSDTQTPSASCICLRRWTSRPPMQRPTGWRPLAYSAGR